MKIRLWGGRFIKVKRLRKILKLQTTKEFKEFLSYLKMMGIIKTHYSGFSSEGHNEGSLAEHEQVITVLDKEAFFDKCERCVL